MTMSFHLVPYFEGWSAGGLGQLFETDRHTDCVYLYIYIYIDVTSVSMETGVDNPSNTGSP